MSSELTLSHLNVLIIQYSEALEEEFRAKCNQAKAQEDITLARARILKDAYDRGEITGKNAEAREREEAVYLAENQVVRAALDDVEAAEEEAANALRVRQALEARISLYRAWLYSLSGALR